VPASPTLAYAATRLVRTAFPNVTITAPAPNIRVDRDVAVPMRDGARLRVNVFRPARDGKFPVIMCAHPYGKDAFPARTPFGYSPPARYRFMRQVAPVRFSAYTTWEAPDPSFWVTREYVVVNVDLRGFGTSDGTAAMLTQSEAEDYAEVIEWAAAQPWSTGKVGLNGVSYLAISQWNVAALRPKSLCAICPWEGFTDVYRDMAYPGGVREDGFTKFWSDGLDREGRTRESLRAGQLAHPEYDDFWSARTPQLERIEVPALICASFSDHGLHTRGGFEAHRRIASKHRFLYTHRGGKWSTYYSPEALALQARFFDCFVKGEDDGMRDAAPVRLEVRSSRDEIHAVRDASAWPLPGTRWTKLHLSPGTLRDTPAEAANARVDLPEEGATFVFRATEDMELAGPMKLRLHVELEDATDAHLFVAVCKAVDGKDVVFEGTSGFGCDVVTKGWLRLAHRRIDEQRSEPHRPFHAHDRIEPMTPGEIAAVDVELLPSATFFARGEELRLDVRGRWFWKRNAFFGLYPFAYAPSPRARLRLHFGAEHDSFLLVPRTD
jgi:predicted acyl esterase